MIAAMAAILGVYVTWSSAHAIAKQNEQQLKIVENGQVTDRFIRATDQLGSNSSDVRMGGIFALERVMEDSPPDRGTILEELSAYVREHSRLHAHPRPRQTTSTDIQAAISVMARRPSGANFPGGVLDLEDSDLRGVDFNRGSFPSAKLAGSLFDATDLAHVEMPKADLGGIRVCGATFEGANLKGALLDLSDFRNVPGKKRDNACGDEGSPAIFDDADLRDVVFSDSFLDGASFKDADLRGARFESETPRLTVSINGVKYSIGQPAITGNDSQGYVYNRGADLSGTNLSGANLDGTDMRGANLADATLDGTRLYCADLTKTRGLTAQQLLTAVGNAETKLPKGFRLRESNVDNSIGC